MLGPLWEVRRYPGYLPMTSDPLSLFSVLRSCSVFSSLSDVDLGELSAYCHFEKARRGEALWAEGEAPPYFAAIASGFVRMVRSTSVGVDVTTEIFGPRQVCGLLGVVRGTGCPQTALAVCETLYVKVPADRFMVLYEENAGMKDLLLVRTSQRLVLAHSTFAQTTTSRAEVRLAQVISMLSDSYSEVLDGGFRLTVPLTRQMLAEMSGMTVETVIRVLGEWKRQGLVRTSFKHIVVASGERFRQILISQS